MSGPLVIQAAGQQGADAVLLARARLIDGTYLTQAALSSIALTVYDLANNMAVVTGPIALTISAVVFDTLQAGFSVLWPVDTIGYNFRYRLAGAAAFPNARTYRVTIIFTLTDATKFAVQYDIPAAPVP